MYCIVDPFNLKAIEFSSFKDENRYFAYTSLVNGNYQVLTRKALCVEVEEPSQSLLGKVYNPRTNTFS